MSTDFLQILSQFGAAGLIGVLWITERRLAGKRERQLSEAHRKLVAQQHDLHSMIAVVRDNTRAIVALEHTQRQLIELVQQLAITPAARHGRPSAA